MQRETKKLLKSIGNLIGWNLTDFAVDTFNLLTLNIPKTMMEKRVQREIAERLYPNLMTMSPEMQLWDLLRVGMSEEEAGRWLGLPETVALEDRDSNEITWCYSSKGLHCGVVIFGNKKVTYFAYRTNDGHTVKSHPYVGSSDNKIFHRHDEVCVDEISSENFVGYETRKAAMEDGYKPCEKCKP
ncbi:MAG: hypothetical protein KAS75_02330 [Planctomycetes bacterium]|nr:hypothetical protein [Planctomycetota bacterium]